MQQRLSFRLRYLHSRHNMWLRSILNLPEKPYKKSFLRLILFGLSSWNNLLLCYGSNQCTKRNNQCCLWHPHLHSYRPGVLCGNILDLKNHLPYRLILSSRLFYRNKNMGLQSLFLFWYSLQHLLILLKRNNHRYGLSIMWW